MNGVNNDSIIVESRRMYFLFDNFLEEIYDRE